MPASRRMASLSSVQMGSSDRLPLVATTGNASSAISTWCSGVQGSIAPRYGLPGATEGAIPELRKGWRPLRSTSTMGDSGDWRSLASRSETAHSFPTAASDGNIRASGFSSLRFSSRSRRTASSFRASTTRWNPPMPLTAATLPWRMAPAVASRASWRDASARPSASHRSSCGPHSGQAFGCAWNLLSAGSRYSASHDRHIGKPLIVVLGRS